MPHPLPSSMLHTLTLLMGNGRLKTQYDPTTPATPLDSANLTHFAAGPFFLQWLFSRNLPNWSTIARLHMGYCTDALVTSAFGAHFGPTDNVKPIRRQTRTITVSSKTAVTSRSVTFPLNMLNLPSCPNMVRMRYPRRTRSMGIDMPSARNKRCSPWSMLR